MRLALVLFCVLALFAQEPKPKTGAATHPIHNETDATNAVKQPPPAIPADHAAEYFAAKVAMVQAEAQQQAAKIALDAAVKKIIADCSPMAVPSEGQAGKMMCEAKPAPKPEAANPAPAK